MPAQTHGSDAKRQVKSAIARVHQCKHSVASLGVSCMHEDLHKCTHIVTCAYIYRAALYQIF